MAGFGYYEFTRLHMNPTGRGTVHPQKLLECKESRLVFPKSPFVLVMVMLRQIAVMIRVNESH